MYLKKINNVCAYEKGRADDVDNDGIYGNADFRDFDVKDRNHWAYVGLSDKAFEGKKKIVARAKKVRETEASDDYVRFVFDDETCSNRFAFFGVYETEDDKKPIAYLAVKHNRDCRENAYGRAIVVASDVDGWEMGKIQAYLMNQILTPMYEGSNLDAHKEVPFVGNAVVARVAAESGDFRFCKMEQNARLSSIEKQAMMNL